MQNGKELPWLISSYNVLATGRGRWTDIDHVLLRFHIQAVQSTGARRQEQCWTWSSSNFFWHQWSRHEKYTGVAVGLAKSRFAKQSVVQVFTPVDPVLKGRFGMLRAKTKVYDITVANVYAPVESSERKQQEKVKRFRSAVDRELSLIPARSVLVLLGDFNGKLAMEQDTHGDFLVGPGAAKAHSTSGQAVAHVLRKHHLVATNTLKRTTPAFYGANGKGHSWIDFICIPQALASRVVWAHTLDKEGDMLQYIDTQDRRDHRPVAVSFYYRRWHEQTITQKAGWDKDKMAEAVEYGTGRQPFLEIFYSHCEKVLSVYMSWKNKMMQTSFYKCCTRRSKNQ